MSDIRGRYNPFNLTAFNKRLRHSLLADVALNTDHNDVYYTKDEVNNIVEGNTFDFFLNNTNSDISSPTQYFVMDPTETGEAESTFSDTITGDDFLIDTWATSTSEPTFSALVSGIYAFHIHAETTTGANVGSVRLYWELYRRLADSPFTETLLITSEESNVLVGAETEYDIHGILTDDVVLDATDRLVLKVYANIETSRPTDPLVTLTAEGTTAAHFEVVTTITAFDDRYVFVTGDTMTGPLTILTTTIQDEEVNPTGSSPFFAGHITNTNDYLHFGACAINLCEADGQLGISGAALSGDYINIEGSGTTRLLIQGGLPIFSMLDTNIGDDKGHWLSLLAEGEYRWLIVNDGDTTVFTPLVLDLTTGGITLQSALTLTSGVAGNLAVAGDITIQNAGFIGSVSKSDAIQIDADGDITLVKDLFIGGRFSDGTLSILNGEITEIGRLAGNDLDIVGGTGSWTTSGPLNAGATTVASLISTDDITMQGHLLTMGNAGAATDTVLSFLGSTNSTTITYDESANRFDFGGSRISSGNIGIGDLPASGSIEFRIVNNSAVATALIQSNSNSQLDLITFSDNATTSAQLISRKNRGTAASDGVLVNNDRVGTFTFKGNDGTDDETSGAVLTINVDGSVASDSVPMEFAFEVLPEGVELTRIAAMKIRSSGMIEISTGKMLLINLPDSDPSVTGQLYHIGADVKISL